MSSPECSAELNGEDTNRQCSESETRTTKAQKLWQKLACPFALIKQRFNSLGPVSRLRFYIEYKQQEREADPGRDARENADGRLPEDEGCQVSGVWVIELYTPSTVNGLLDGIKNLGWEYGRTRDEGLSNWMNAVRAGERAGWTNLGLVSRPKGGHFMKERTAILPEGVEAALPILMSITPSITAFISLFILNEEAATSLETPLRKEYATVIQQNKLFRPWHIIKFVLGNADGVRLGYRIHAPDNQRRESVARQLKDLESRCVKWVNSNLPGAFNSLGRSSCPTATLLLTEKIKPLSNESKYVRAFDGLNIRHDFSAWRSDTWPSVLMTLPWGEGETHNRMVFACKRTEAFKPESGWGDPYSNWTISQRADDDIQGLLSRWALGRLLDSYHQKLSELRDQTARDSGYQTIRDLKKLRTFARTLLYDIGICAHEIEEFAKSGGYSIDVMDMLYVNTKPEKSTGIIKGLKSSQVTRAQQVRREATLLQATLSTSNDLSQTISNIRIQLLVVVLTVASIGIGLWSSACGK